MARLIAVVVLVFLVLLALRAIRILAASLFRTPPPAGPPAPQEGEMIRDPICGAWVDRRIAVTGRRAGQPVSVCSEKCRALLEKQA